MTEGGGSTGSWSAVAKVVWLGAVVLAGLALAVTFRADGGGSTGEAPPAWLLLPRSEPTPAPAGVAPTPTATTAPVVVLQADGGGAVWSTPAQFAPPE